MAGTQPQTTAEKVTSYLSRASLSRLSPVPAFPEYSGPYKVGTVDVEIPVSELEAPSPAPETAKDIHTIQFRIFYPAPEDAKGKRITWLPAPQRIHVSAYTQFLGIGPMLASVLSFLPRHLHYTSIPVNKNVDLLEPNDDSPKGRWPTMIFSHGLGGNRNTYSHIAGSLASHGVVVVCPEHRDGSAVVSFVRDPAAQNRYFIRNTRSIVPYHRFPHTMTPEVWESRNAQLRIRLWELGLIHEAILALERGESMTNLNASTPKQATDQFAGKMHVQEPGSIIFAGHSFGAATTIQFLKSTFYADVPEVAAMPDPLFRPRPGSAIRKQITEKNVTILLDCWCFPLISKATEPLSNLPLPAYADVPSAPGGSAILAVESEAFFKWKEHLHMKARVLSADPTARIVEPTAFERPNTRVRLQEPNFFYVQNSAHLSQSDFGILFPWMTKKIFGAEEPERALRLNLRAVLQHLRTNDVPVARTWVGDLVDGTHVSKMDMGAAGNSLGEASAQALKAMNPLTFGNKDAEDGIHDDKAIFDRSGNSAVEAWQWIDIVGMGEEAGLSQREVEAKEAAGTANKDGEDAEQHMEGEIEPHLSEQGQQPMENAREIAAAA